MGDTKGDTNGESLFDSIKSKLSNILRTAQDNNQKLNTNNSGMDDIVQRISALQVRLDAIKNRISELSSRVSTEQLNELSLQIDDIQGAISSQNVDDQKISALNDAITNLEAKVQEIENAFNNNGGPPAAGESKAPSRQGNISNPSNLRPESKEWDPETNSLRGGKRKRRRKRKSKKSRRKRKSKKKGGYKFDAVAIKSRKSRLQTRKLNSRKRKRTKKKRRRRRRKR